MTLEVEFRLERERRREWEEKQEDLIRAMVAEVELQKKFRWQCLALLSFISAAIPVGLTIIGWMIK